MPSALNPREGIPREASAHGVPVQLAVADWGGAPMTDVLNRLTTAMPMANVNAVHAVPSARGQRR